MRASVNQIVVLFAVIAFPTIWLTGRANARTLPNVRPCGGRPIPSLAFPHPWSAPECETFMDILITLCQFLRALVVARIKLATENLALRQQLAVLQRSVPRPRFRRRDRLFWVWLRGAVRTGDLG